MKTSKTAAAYIALVLSCVLWGTVYISNRYALTAVTPAELAFIRFFVSAAILFPALKARKEPVGFRKEDTKYFVRIAVFGYFLSIELIMLSTKYAGASLSSLINSMSPILITVFAVLILKEKMTAAKILCLIVSLTGVVIVSGGVHDGGTAFGVILCLCSILTWSLAAITTRRIAARYDAIHITTTGILLSLLLHIPVAGVSMIRNGIPSLTPLIVFCLLYSGSVGTALPHFLWNYGLEHLPASTCTMFYPLMPLTSALLGAPLLGEKLGAGFYIGGAMITSALIISGIAEAHEHAHHPHH